MHGPWALSAAAGGATVVTNALTEMLSEVLARNFF